MTPTLDREERLLCDDPAIVNIEHCKSINAQRHRVVKDLIIVDDGAVMIVLAGGIFGSSVAVFRGSV